MRKSSSPFSARLWAILLFIGLVIAYVAFMLSYMSFFWLALDFTATGSLLGFFVLLALIAFTGFLVHY